MSAVIIDVGIGFLDTDDFLGEFAIHPLADEGVVASDLGPADVRFRDARDRSRRRNVEISGDLCPSLTYPKWQNAKYQQPRNVAKTPFHSMCPLKLCRLLWGESANE